MLNDKNREPHGEAVAINIKIRPDLKMKRLLPFVMFPFTRKFLFFIIFLLNILVQSLSYSQPNIPLSDISDNIHPEVRRLIEKLYSSDPEERRFAISRLGEMGDKANPAIPFLIGSLHDETTFQYPPKFSYISLGNEAAEALVKIGTSTVKDLIGALKDGNPVVRQNAAWALGKLRNPEAVNSLIAALKKTKPQSEDFSVYIYALGKIGDPRAVEPLVKLLNGEHYHGKSIVAEALGKIGDPRAVEPLIAILQERDPWIQRNAADALGNIGDPRALKPLISVLKNKALTSRMNVISAILKIETPEALNLIVNELKNDDPDMRIMAAIILGKMKDPRAIKPLVAALDDNDRQVKYHVARALKIITGQEFRQDEEKTEDWLKEIQKENIKHR